jgi:S-adenosylmethionine:tRNA ribosyltransferase-isomerase
MADRRFTTADFDYDLPDELIAQVPSRERGQSRLLVVDRNDPVVAPPVARQSLAPSEAKIDAPPVARLRDLQFPDLLSLIPSGDVLVINSTKVRHARLLGTRPAGGPAEVLLLHPLGEDHWLAMGKPGRALLPGKRIVLGDGIEIETIAVQEDGYRQVRFVGADAATAIARFGQLPLPPYITRSPDAVDEERYQTIFARHEGSVAAPTAGLHFTHEVMQALTDRGVEVAEIELEVGPGTFKPVEVAEITDHPMHAERYEIPVAAAAKLARARPEGGRIWAVGTTVVRALESAARDDGTVTPGPGETRLLITPGFQFRVVDHLLTNFHLPRSTLLMLVAAFAGYERTMAAYHHAVAERYRFYSYGDAMCIL